MLIFVSSEAYEYCIFILSLIIMWKFKTQSLLSYIIWNIYFSISKKMSLSNIYLALFFVVVAMFNVASVIYLFVCYKSAFYLTIVFSPPSTDILFFCPSNINILCLFHSVHNLFMFVCISVAESYILHFLCTACAFLFFCTTARMLLFL